LPGEDVQDALRLFAELRSPADFLVAG
jgi:hypothetical protein